MLKRIFQNRNLTLLWAGQMASQSGDSVFQIGLLWLTLELSGSESVTGLVAMSSYLPAVLLALLAGVVADRSNRRRIMLASDGLRALLIMLIPIAALSGALSPWLLAAVAFTLAIAATFFNPARDSLIPQIVAPDGLMRANSLIQTSWQFSLLIGPAMAGLLLHLVGNVHLFTADAALYLLSFVAVFLIRLQPALPATQHSNDGASGRIAGGWSQIHDGLGYVTRQPVILPLLLLTVADNIFIMGPAIVGTPVFVRQELGLGAEAYALVQACLGIGMLLGTAALLGLGGRFNKGKVLLVGMVLDGITFIPLFWANSLAAMEATIILHSLAIPLITVSRAALIQSIVPAQYTGRVFALVNMAVVGMSAVSAGLAGVALDWWGARWVFLVIGAAGGICGMVGWVLAKDLKSA